MSPAGHSQPHLIQSTIDFAPRGSSTDGHLRRLFSQLDGIQLPKVNGEPIRHIRTAGKACMTAAADGKLNCVRAMLLVSLKYQRNDRGDLIGFLGLDNARRL